MKFVAYPQEGILKSTNLLHIYPKIHLCFIFTAFLGLPLGPSLRDIGFAGALLSALFSPDIKHQFSQLKKSAWVYASLFVGAIALMGTLYSPALFNEKILIFTKYAKIAFLPLFYLAFNDDKAKNYAIHGFILGMMITATLSVAKSYGWILNTRNDPGFIFYNHIITSYMMSVAIYLCLYQIKTMHHTLKPFYLWALSLFVYQLIFINTGRTGYVSGLFLVLCWLFQFEKPSKALAIIFVILGLSFAGMHLSTSFKNNLQNTQHNMSELAHKEKNNSFGFRLQFHQYAHVLWSRHPIVGNGTASFKALFAKEDPVPAYKEGILLEPHNIFWLFASELGGVGLVGLLLFLGTLAFNLLKYSPYTQMGIAIFTSFLLMNFTDSLLFHSASGFFFLYFMALCLNRS